MLPFEFIIEGPPVSQQTRRRAKLREWKRKIREHAESQWPPEEFPHMEQLIIKITYFYDEVSMDVDNIPKPISDALNGLVYFDDEQLTDNYTRKRNLNDELIIENPSTVLASGLSLETEFLYIIIDEAPNQQVID
ncbi:MAG: RusA family crossover junction endodeoxyribonuclease [Deltaproteobacteria bacterium]|nr:MAG: RusA family crossover junction endodeoxyribonuclease [Deltaproteobacteria bacterium]